MKRFNVSRWLDDNPYFAGAIVMLLLGFLAGIGRTIFQNPTLHLERGAMVSILLAFIFGCMAVWHHSNKGGPDDESK